MKLQTRRSAITAILAVALLSLATVAGAVNYNQANGLTGTVVSTNHDLNYITVRDDVTGRNFKVDTRQMVNNGRHNIDVWNLRAGDRVTATGSWENSDTFQATHVMQASAAALSRLANGITGTVQDVNRDLNYITILDPSTNLVTKVDVRHIDTRRSVNVWDLRTGDLVTAHGTIAKNGNFRADFVNFSSSVPMASGGYNANTVNVLSGTVDSVNRDLNYFILRNDVTGQPVKIDVREMDTRRSVNVWNLRAGDRITVSGSWAPQNDRFQAATVNF
jgi:uncharacterized protein DUF5666